MKFGPFLPAELLEFISIFWLISSCHSISVVRHGFPKYEHDSFPFSLCLIYLSALIFLFPVEVAEQLSNYIAPFTMFHIWECTMAFCPPNMGTCNMFFCPKTHFYLSCAFSTQNEHKEMWSIPLSFLHCYVFIGVQWFHLWFSAGIVCYPSTAFYFLLLSGIACFDLGVIFARLSCLAWWQQSCIFFNLSIFLDHLSYIWQMKNSGL